MKKRNPVKSSSKSERPAVKPPHPVADEKNLSVRSTGGAATGALVGAVVGGPLGAVVGGAVGLIVGGASATPPQKKSMSKAKKRRTVKGGKKKTNRKPVRAKLSVTRRTRSGK